MMEVKRLVGLDISDSLHSGDVEFHVVYPVLSGIKILVRNRSTEEEIHLRTDDFEYFVDWLNRVVSVLEREKESRSGYISGTEP